LQICFKGFTVKFFCHKRTHPNNNIHVCVCVCVREMYIKGPSINYVTSEERGKQQLRRMNSNFSGRLYIKTQKWINLSQYLRLNISCINYFVIKKQTQIPQLIMKFFVKYKILNYSEVSEVRENEGM
jgi:hypothetical protein